MKINMNQFIWLRGLGNASYIIGTALIMAALLTSFVPPTTAVANQRNYPLNCPPATKTPTNTPDPTDTPEPPTNTPTDTPEPPTFTPTNTPTDTSEPPTNTPTDTVTNTATNTPTDTPTDTPTSTPTETPTSTPTYHDPFSLEVFCYNIRITSFNDFVSSFAWTITNGPSGTGVLDPFGYVDIETGYYPGSLVILYSDNKIMDSDYFPTNCEEDKDTPTPPKIPSRTPGPSRTPRNPTKVYDTLVPKISITPDIIIPVTGLDLAGGGSASRTLFNLGLAFLGLGFVINGLARHRKELENYSP
jgi:hypothetical protein